MRDLLCWTKYEQTMHINSTTNLCTRELIFKIFQNFEILHNLPVLGLCMKSDKNEGVIQKVMKLFFFF